MSRTLQAAAVATLLVSGFAQAQDPNDAFTVDRRSFKDNYPVIALAPIDAVPYLQMPDSVAEMIEAELTERLEKEKFTVIPSSRLAAIRARMEEQVGGITDPATGEIDADKQAAVREHAFRELWFQEEFDALAIARVSIYQVPIESDNVEWDGVKQRIERKGRSRDYRANISVSSITFGMYDATNKPIYTWYGGLEPLMYRDGEQLIPLEPAQFFLDEDKVLEAAEIAVDPF